LLLQFRRTLLPAAPRSEGGFWPARSVSCVVEFYSADHRCFVLLGQCFRVSSILILPGFGFRPRIAVLIWACASNWIGSEARFRWWIPISFFEGQAEGIETHGWVGFCRAFASPPTCTLCWLIRLWLFNWMAYLRPGAPTVASVFFLHRRRTCCTNAARSHRGRADVMQLESDAIDPQVSFCFVWNGIAIRRSERLQVAPPRRCTPSGHHVAPWHCC
jgi:hypothetical protein